MASEQVYAQNENWGLWLWIVIYRCIANGSASVRLLEKSVAVGENPALHLPYPVYGVSSKNHVPWDWNAKGVVHFISCSILV